MLDQSQKNIDDKSIGNSNENLEIKNLIETQIIGIGNYFYRCLCLEIDQTQGNYRYYRSLVYNYTSQNKLL